MVGSACDLVLVAGATGGVGQLVVAKILEKTSFRVRVLTRNADKAKNMFAESLRQDFTIIS